jgi:hypothetical protein
MVASYVRERERIFLRGLKNVEATAQPASRSRRRLQGMGRRLQRSRICRRDGAALRPAPRAALIGGAHCGSPFVALNVIAGIGLDCVRCFKSLFGNETRNHCSN